MKKNSVSRYAADEKMLIPMYSDAWLLPVGYSRLSGFSISLIYLLSIQT